MKSNISTDQLIDRWEDRRDVKNIMGKYVHYLLLKKEGDVVNDLWSRRDDICYGINDGWYNGREAVDNYYSFFSGRTARVAAIMKAKFPDELSSKADEELFGTGLLELKSVSNHIIEIAEDGLTAKAFGCIFGFDTIVNEHGPVSNWIFATVGMDFILEEDETAGEACWKIWHMQYLEDINCPSGTDWGDKQVQYPFSELDEFKSLKGDIPPLPNKPVRLRERFSGTRPHADLPAPPEPYATFSKTFSYGI